jgi:hemerythrin-like domain-containing protein
MTRPIRLADLAPGKSASYEQPFEMLEACHERVHRMLDLLQRLRTHVARSGADEQARQAARDVMRYFDLAAPQHHLDEERHVLPAMASSGDAELVALAQRLHQDHVAMETGWTAARAILMALSDGALPTLNPEQHQCLESFAALYGDHIRAEEEVAYPAASSRFGADQVAAMAQDMMRRRGLV